MTPPPPPVNNLPQIILKIKFDKHHVAYERLPIPNIAGAMIPHLS